MLIIFYKRPSYHGDIYFCPKQCYAFNVQVRCDKNNKILYFYGDWPASTHDNRAWQNCRVFTNIDTPTPTVFVTPSTAFSTPTAEVIINAKARGPGSGRQKIKSIAMDKHFKTKRIKFHVDFLQSMNQRQKTYSDYVTSIQQNQIFKNAGVTLELFEDSDREEAAKYKRIISSIMTRENHRVSNEHLNEGLNEGGSNDNLNKGGSNASNDEMN